MLNRFLARFSSFFRPQKTLDIEAQVLETDSLQKCNCHPPMCCHCKYEPINPAAPADPAPTEPDERTPLQPKDSNRYDGLLKALEVLVYALAGAVGGGVGVNLALCKLAPDGTGYMCTIFGAKPGPG
jgi:hypothetical protein